MRPTRAASRGGWALYELYRTTSRVAAPAVLLWRRLQGLEHPTRWPERLGRPSAARPRPGSPLVWFHAVSLGEGMAALPIVRHCVRLRPGLPVLFTTTTLSSSEVIMDLLPDGVIYQFAPLDCPTAIDSFIGYWKPSLVLLLESELWPNLIMSAAAKGIAVALLNARISLKSFNHWSMPLMFPLVSLMLSKLSLVVPLSTIQAVRFQLLHTPPGIIHFAGDLKYGILKFFILRIHEELVNVYPVLLLILVPRHPEDCKNISLALKKQKVNFVLRSTREVVSSITRVYMVDTLGELRMLYRVTPIAVVGGSFLPGLAGHNFSEAAAAGCAVMTGPHVGHFYHMLVEMWQINPLAVKQVSGEFELLQTLKELLGDASTLGARQRAAKDAFSIMSDGVVNRVWDLVCRLGIDSQTNTLSS
ncbi:putative 3-deoxy-D-manno-octulosonic acid transferase mitochondrial [Zea mays]|uniref:lipid IVA 3-deoxy-D-manno-octulosonic acid transferase n=1 Tax=Zea mays TaxID=4577 RepID=A0A1D6N6V1_MAIZE|nr:putative 3-deoxy-D-manno-octulosonic acid transferase mitochondrial [Zea mays]